MSFSSPLNFNPNALHLMHLTIISTFTSCTNSSLILLTMLSIITPAFSFSFLGHTWIFSDPSYLVLYHSAQTFLRDLLFLLLTFSFLSLILVLRSSNFLSSLMIPCPKPSSWFCRIFNCWSRHCSGFYKLFYIYIFFFYGAEQKMP